MLAAPSQPPARGGPARELSLLDHLEELRSRILLSLAFWAAGALVAYLGREHLLKFLTAPLERFQQGAGSVQIVTTSLLEPLTTVLSLSLYGGLVLALPLLAGQLWAFLAPALTPLERRWAVPFIAGVGGAFLAGSAFAYFWVLPAALPIMLGFLPGVSSLLSIGHYLQQVLGYLVGCGLTFELPLLMVLLSAIGLLRARTLWGLRRYAVVALLIVAALLSPSPDLVSYALVAVPLLLLFEVGLLCARAVENRRTVRTG